MRDIKQQSSFKNDTEKKLDKLDVIIDRLDQRIEKMDQDRRDTEQRIQDAEQRMTARFEKNELKFAELLKDVKNSHHTMVLSVAAMVITIAVGFTAIAIAIFLSIRTVAAVPSSPTHITSPGALTVETE